MNEPVVLHVDKEIVLKQLQWSDASSIFVTISTQREHLGKWLPFVEFTRELSDSEKYVNSVIHAPEDKFEYVFCILKEGNFAGLIGFKDTDRQNLKSEMGYWLSEKYLKQGIITKSVKTLCTFAFEKMGMNRLQIRCAVANYSSKKIPQRLSFTFEGIERDGELLSGGVFTDLEVYSLLKSEFASESGTQH